MPLPSSTTVREQIAWSYANLVRAEAALKSGATCCEKIRHIIRGKLYHGLASGRMTMRSLFDVERLKLTFRSPAAIAAAPTTWRWAI